jgi:DNA-3-methyladenine glycosylase II
VPYVMCDSPAWSPVPDGMWLRVFGAAPRRWCVVAVTRHMTWRIHGPAHHHHVPDPITPPAAFAETVPAPLARTLRSLEEAVRWRTPDLWESIALAILRRDVDLREARRLTERFKIAYGTPVPTPFGARHLMPTARTTAGLSHRTFTVRGMAVRRGPLIQAATAYVADGAVWQAMPPQQMVETLRKVPGIGPWAAGVAVADYTHDWSTYPLGDGTLRRAAAAAARTVAWPSREEEFTARWRQIAGTDLGALTFLTLAWAAKWC